jgi:hypothetical protein
MQRLNENRGCSFNYVAIFVWNNLLFDLHAANMLRLHILLILIFFHLISAIAETIRAQKPAVAEDT